MEKESMSRTGFPCGRRTCCLQSFCGKTRYDDTAMECTKMMQRGRVKGREYQLRHQGGGRFVGSHTISWSVLTGPNTDSSEVEPEEQDCLLDCFLLLLIFFQLTLIQLEAKEKLINITRTMRHVRQTVYRKADFCRTSLKDVVIQNKDIFSMWAQLCAEWSSTSKKDKRNMFTQTTIIKIYQPSIQPRDGKIQIEIKQTYLKIYW